MSVPGSNTIQLVPAGATAFTVDEVTDPNGDPANVLDVDLGFAVSGTIVLPNWMNGSGHVAIYADEVGGPIDREIGAVDVAIVATGGEPGLTTYNWTVNFPGSPPVLPDPSTGSQLYHLAAIFTFGGQATDIASFVEMGPYLVN